MKKAFLAIETIIKLAIALIALFIVIALVARGGHFFSGNVNTCEANKGICVKSTECPPLSIINSECKESKKTKEGYVCCIK